MLGNVVRTEQLEQLKTQQCTGKGELWSRAWAAWEQPTWNAAPFLQEDWSEMAYRSVGGRGVEDAWVGKCQNERFLVAFHELLILTEMRMFVFPLLVPRPGL